MSRPDPTVPGLLLAGLLVALAGWFAAAQLHERRRRPGDLPEPDRRYFRRKDVRRLSGSLLMLAVAGAMAVGLWIDPRDGRTERQLWAASWLVVLGLIVVLLVLALWDWLALGPYARRAFRRLDLERRQAAAELDRLRRPPSSPRPPPAAL